MIKIETSIVINADAKKVWKNLTDLDSYQKWNPFIINASGNVKYGNSIAVTLKTGNGNGMKIKPKIVFCEPLKGFSWTGRLLVSGIFDGNHYFMLQSLGTNRTKLIHGEKFSGFLVQVILAPMKSNLIKSFNDMNRALKYRVESGK